MVQIAPSSKRRSKRQRWFGMMAVLLLVAAMISLSMDNNDAVMLAIEQQFLLFDLNATVNPAVDTGIDIATTASPRVSDGELPQKPENSGITNSSISDSALKAPVVKSGLNLTVPTIKEELDSFPPVYPRDDAVLAIQPSYGRHRTDQREVIFSFARGYELQDYLPFVSSLFAQNYEGDLVLGVSSDLSQELKEYFEYLVQEYLGVVIYEIPLSCIAVKIRTHCQTVGMFRVGSDILADTRNYREVAQLRFEYYWAWTTMYSAENAHIWLLDSRDVYFQRHPSSMESSQLLLRNTNSTSASSTLHVFEESSSEPIWKQRSNRRWIKKAYGEETFQEMRYHTVICSGSTYGGQPAIELYTRAMVHQFDVTNCTVYGCDQGHHNYLVRQNKLLGAGAAISDVEIYKQGDGIVNTLGLLVSNVGNLTDLRLLNDQLEVLNNDRTTVSPIVHQFDRDTQFRNIIEDRKRKLLNEWKRLRSKTKS